MAGTFPDRHPDAWLTSLTRKGLVMVVVVPGLTELQDTASLDDLRSAWCAFAEVVQPR